MIVGCPVGAEGSLIWTMMITSARHGRWPGDIEIGRNHADYGLPVASYIRTAKIAAIELISIERKVGTLSDAALAEVTAALKQTLGL